ncbi:NlpE N-terminal domain-containing protein [Tangfeifania diversioriginum]|uniref:NlpE N-terminal domain-containing protein n=1 Tax=Tangfeifania diversioriginum TaxID=1168035 RepID=A0A1M6M1F7_9BACT|nr:copper resistance protein NlpE [Tangfeifania diversioriginum]SHJ77173.1 NlpE N-terminal domain-containing protein [Tangfeifania diversioriginum]
MKDTVFLFIFCLGFLVFVGCRNSTKETEISKDGTETLAALPDMHTSQIAIDYHGTYKGVVPCADCEGMETVITLKENEEYEIAVKYLGKSDAVYKESGNFSWGDDGRIITLEGLENRASQYQVGENKLFQLDLEGNRITGDLAENYILEKTN